MRTFKRLLDLPENHFFSLFFFYISFCFLCAAFFMPDRGDMLAGLIRILSSPTRLSANFFVIGGFAGTFLNMGLVGLFSSLLYCLPGKDKNNPTGLLVHLLTIGFAAWGLNVLNIWPTIFGVILYGIVNKKPLGELNNAMLFTTGLAPITSELLLRYPDTQNIGFSVHGVVLALAVGLLIGYFLPVGLENSPRVHRGMAIYSAALPVGMTAFFLQGLLYKGMGIEIPAAVGSDMSVESPLIVNGFCLFLFTSCILFALLMGCRWKDYWQLLVDPKPVNDFAKEYGCHVMMMNVGVYGLFILAYYNIIDASFNASTFGTILGMVATCNAGSHPFNVLPIIWGYSGASKLLQFVSRLAGGTFTQYLNAQPIVVGLCYANGLTPISDQYGWLYGVAAAFFHYCMVTTVPNLHGGLCLYNGGFTAALVCLLLVPSLERLFRTKFERRGQSV